MIIEKRSSVSPLRIIGGVFGFLGGLLAWQLGVRPMLIEYQADKALSQTAAFEQIKRWDPEAYAQMKRAAVSSMRRGESPARLQGGVRAVVAGVVKKYIPHASDEALLDYLRITMEEVAQVNAKDPDAAYAMLFGNDMNFDMTKYVDEKTQQRDVAALAEIIRTGVAKEAGYQNNERATRLLQNLVQQFRSDVGADAELLALAVQGGGGDKRRTVDMTIELYRRVLAMRTDQAAQVFRLMLANAPA